ncbi:MAG TPA: hypothetical protein VGI67_09235 [Thermoleophilaceae bacterium]|jgi:GABA permease
MAYRTRVLVVANRTADSEGLTQALSDREDAADATFTLLVPVQRKGPARAEGLEAAREQLTGGIGRLRDAGLDADGQVGDPDPIVAVAEIWKPGAFDEVIVSTLEREASRWLEYDLPHRISKLTDCPVQHVVPAEIERERAREQFRRPLRPAPKRALGPFVGPSET